MKNEDSGVTADEREDVNEGRSSEPKEAGAKASPDEAQASPDTVPREHYTNLQKALHATRRETKSLKERLEAIEREKQEAAEKAGMDEVLEGLEEEERELASKVLDIANRKFTKELADRDKKALSEKFLVSARIARLAHPDFDSVVTSEVIDEYERRVQTDPESLKGIISGDPYSLAEDLYQAAKPESSGSKDGEGSKEPDSEEPEEKPSGPSRPRTLGRQSHTRPPSKAKGIQSMTLAEKRAALKRGEITLDDLNESWREE